MQEINIGIAGLGVVGSGVLRHLERNADILGERSGFRFRVRRLAVRDAAKVRNVNFDHSLLASSPLDLANDPSLQIIVELMGGLETPEQLIRASLEKGKGVVTANKHLLSEKAESFLALAAKNRVPLCYEASVAGGIPILKALSEGLVANRILSLHGIINGTCNFILSGMTQSGQSFAEALADAQQQGFAEADPTLDVDGLDAMHKAVILTALAYGFWVDPKRVFVEGIRNLDAADFRYAKLLNYTIKLLAIIRCDETGTVEVRVHPTLIPSTHVLASVSGSFNAVAVRGDVVGDTLFYGRGAGSDATASAVISDLVDAALSITQGAVPARCRTHALYAKYKPIEETISRYYVRLSVVDQPGVLAQIASAFGRQGIGISSVFQPKSHEGDHTPLVFMLDDAPEKACRAALAEIEALPVVGGKAVALRVEDFES